MPTPATQPKIMPAGFDLDPRALLLIVVGAHLRAEVSDRPLAYRLREQILRWQDQVMDDPDSDIDATAFQPVVCSDVWYVNAADLHARPAIAIGDPQVNAASAMLSTQLSTAFVIEHTLRIHLDLEFIDLRACMWGANHSATVSAVEAFVERYLDKFLHAALAM